MRQMPVVLIELERDHAGDFGQRVEFEGFAEACLAFGFRGE